jgi:hypothetical protein
VSVDLTGWAFYGQLGKLFPLDFCQNGLEIPSIGVTRLDMHAARRCIFPVTQNQHRLRGCKEACRTGTCQNVGDERRLQTGLFTRDNPNLSSTRIVMVDKNIGNGVRQELKDCYTRPWMLGRAADSGFKILQLSNH